MDLLLFYEGPSPQAVLREWLRPQPTYVVGSQLAEPKLAKPIPDGWTVVSTATSMDGVDSHAMAWTGDVPLSPDGSLSAWLSAGHKLVRLPPDWARSSRDSQ